MPRSKIIGPQGNLGRRNIIINGGMQISQRIGTTATAITGGNYGLDRWGMYYSGNSFTTQQVTDAPAGFYNSMKLTVTGTTTPTYSFFGQRIEGLNVNHIGLGTANCKSFTVSFYVKSSVAGVYSISMTNGAGDLAYPVQYTIDSANTWERKSMTIPPITSGTWVKDNTNGLYLRMNLGSPGSRTAAANGWRSGNFDGADGSTGAVTWATTSGATFFMTGCQIEVGSEVTEFEHRSFAEELLLCKRYYQQFGGSQYKVIAPVYPPSPSELALCQRYLQSVRSGIVGFCAGTNGIAYWTVDLKPQMRTTPTVTCDRVNYRYGDVVSIGVEMTNITVVTNGYSSSDAPIWYVTGTASATPVQYRNQLLEPQNDTHGRFFIQAEL